MKRDIIQFFCLLFAIVFLNISCTSESGNGENPPTSDEANDPVENEGEENLPPSNFELVNVENGKDGVALNPTLEWTESIDPENDSVTYTVYLGKEENPTIQVVSGLTSLSHVLEYDLDFGTTYFWKVEAKDSEGNVTTSQIFSFKTRPIGTFVASPPFGARHHSAVVEFNGKLFVIAGFGVTSEGGVHYLDDIWSSADGEEWIKETDSPGFMPRALHQVVVFDNKMFLIGGTRIDGAPSNDIWSSVDGINWILEKENAAFPADWGHKILSYNDKLWLITGGQNELLNRNVWNSGDGVNWSLVTEDVGFDVSQEQEAIVFDNKMWVVVQDKVYSSTDGVDWTLELGNAPFPTDGEYSLTVLADKLILMTSDRSNDASALIWTSTNGKDWDLEHQETAFPNREDNSMIVFLNRVYVLLGIDEFGYLDDVWTLN